MVFRHMILFRSFVLIFFEITSADIFQTIGADGFQAYDIIQIICTDIFRDH